MDFGKFLDGPGVAGPLRVRRVPAHRRAVLAQAGDLRRAAVAVAPLTYGAGIQNKVLEAMACATPVVASPQAVSALDVVPGRDVLVARFVATFAHSLEHLAGTLNLRSSA